MDGIPEGLRVDSEGRSAVTGTVREEQVRRIVVLEAVAIPRSAPAEPQRQQGLVRLPDAVVWIEEGFDGGEQSH